MNRLDKLLKNQHRFMTEFSSGVFLSYLRKIRVEKMDRIYRQGYKKIPEESMEGESQINVSGEILSVEQWPG